MGSFVVWSIATQERESKRKFKTKKGIIVYFIYDSN